jgi:recombination protein RecT
MSASKQGMMIANQKSIAGLLKQMEGEITRCLPKHLTAERMGRIAMTELRKNPKLQECEPMSFIAAIMQASQLGLEPGVLGSCYLIPFNNHKKGIVECVFMPGYRGFLDLARRSGQIVSLVSRAVYTNDVFEYEFGLTEKLTHKPSMDNPGDLIAVYGVAHLKDGGHQFDVMSKKQVDVIRNGSQGKNSDPWTKSYDEMAKKTVIRRLFKWLPCSIEMQKAVSLDEMQEQGRQDIKSSASEDFDMSFTIEGEAFESAKEDDLMNILKNNKDMTKKVDPETGEVLPDELQSNPFNV